MQIFASGPATSSGPIPTSRQKKLPPQLQSIDATVFVAPGVQIYGKVQVGEGSSIWPYAVVRAEAQEVSIGRFTNIQDFVMIHVGYHHPTHIGDHCSVAHHSIVHGATVGDACLIGVNATLMDGAVIGAGSIVAGGAFVREGAEFPPGSVVAGIPAKQIAARDCAAANRENAWHYHRNAQAYLRDHHRAWDGPDYEAWVASMRADVESGRDLDR